MGTGHLIGQFQFLKDIHIIMFMIYIVIHWNTVNGKFSHSHCGGIVTLFSMGLDTLSAVF